MAFEGRTDSLEEEVGGIATTAKEKLSDVKEAAEEYYEKGISKAKELGSNLESYVRDNPVRCLLIAGGISLGAGLALGALLRK